MLITPQASDLHSMGFREGRVESCSKIMFILEQIHYIGIHL